MDLELSITQMEILGSFKLNSILRFKEKNYTMFVIVSLKNFHDFYIGNFQNGKAHGKGIYTWKNGDIYDGEWKEGVKEGNGMWKGVNNESYIGEWKDSKCHGYGVHVWANGDRYEGEWRR